jgi:hypothetical protein
MKAKNQTRRNFAKSITGLFTAIPFLYLADGEVTSDPTGNYEKRIRLLPDRPPPIVIKSGSFIIESDVKLKPESGGQPRYRRENFEKIRGLRIYTYNEKKKKSVADDFEERKDWKPSENVQVNIVLEYCERVEMGNCVSWTAGPTIVAADNNSHFDITTPIRLSADKENNHPKRRAKREDEETRAFRFRRVEIIAGGEAIKSYEEDGQEYVIAFYNSLARRR